MTYPPAPWNMHGQLWLSLFRVREGDHPDRPAGVYGVALVSYERPSPLTYSELLVATSGGQGVTITDIWVDSADSRDGGRELWAIPKDLCDFRFENTGRRLQRTPGQHLGAVTPIARRGSATSPTLPAHAVQGRHPAGAAPHDDRAGEEVVAYLKGSAKVLSLPCARGSSTPRGRSPGWQASGPSRRSGWPTFRYRSADSARRLR